MTVFLPLKKGALRREKAIGLIMVMPALVGLMVFIVAPFLTAVVMSFTHYRLGSPNPVMFTIDEYVSVLNDATFWRALLNNLIFLSVVVPLQTGMALGLALLLNKKMRGMVVFRTLFFMPVVFPMSLVAVIWLLIFADSPNGLLNTFLEWICGGCVAPIDFLHHRYWAFPAVILTSIWQGVGFQMVILLAGLQSVPKVLYEAAAIDGAGTLSCFRHVTLPQIRNSLIFVIVVTSILSFRVFDQVRIMTQGGPGDSSTTIVNEIFVRSFEYLQISRGLAMSVILFFIILLLALLQVRFLKQETTLK